MRIPGARIFEKSRGVNHLIFTAQLDSMLIERAPNGVSKANFAVGIVFQNDEIIFFASSTNRRRRASLSVLPPGLPNVGTGKQL